MRMRYKPLKVLDMISSQHQLISRLILAYAIENINKQMMQKLRNIYIGKLIGITDKRQN